MMTLRDLEIGAQRSNLTLAKDLQTTICKMMVSYSKPLGPMI